MGALAVKRPGLILAVADVERSRSFYVERLGFAEEAIFDDPPFAILTLAGMRLSLAEQGHPADDRPGVGFDVPADRSSLQAALVIEVDGVRETYERLRGEGVEFLAEPFEPPWGGCRCYAVDPDGYLVELEELA